MSIRLFTPLLLFLLFASTTAQASYFVDTPPEPIGRRMEGCFAEKKCAAQATRLVPLFAKISGIAEVNVSKALRSCETPDSNMSFCVSYEVFAVKDELTDIVRARLRKNPLDKAAVKLRDMGNWSQQLEEECLRDLRKIDPDAQGRFYSELLAACESNRVIATVKKLR